jgi:XTP/dITP diphosphohydrolase
MSVPKTILFATGNGHKLGEVAAVFSPSGIAVEGLGSFAGEIAEPVEDGRTFIANAILKARYYAAKTGRVALADDSGLVVDALGGAPGVVSARYSGVTGPRSVVDPANNARLLRELEAVPDEARTARFVCVMALCDGERTLAVSRGEVEGLILRGPRGVNGFGYDPLFYFPERGRTTAELEADEKNAISHRGWATRAMIQLVRRLWGR